MLSDFAVTADAVAATSRKSEKERIVAAFLETLEDDSLRAATLFFAGAPFARNEQRVTGVGWATIAEAFLEASGVSAEALWDAYPRHADLGDAIAEVAPQREPSLTLPEVYRNFEALSATAGAGEKRALLADLFRRAGPGEARYLTKILQSELRIGLQEGLVEAALARAFEQPLQDVRRANMLTGDLGATALLARRGSLGEAQLSLFQPCAFMLAQPMETAGEIVAALGPGALADDKYDGIRAQVHSDGSRVRIYSRTLDDITHRFPEVEESVARLGAELILDGEIVAFREHVRPFALLQKRLGRSKVTQKLRDDAPVVFFAFDLLRSEGESLLDTPLSARLERLRTLLAPIAGSSVHLSEQSPIVDAEHVDELFDAARARANEGLVIKDPASLYTPGRRGGTWLKYKKALATLDCVVTAAQYGNGKRRAVLSDLTFAVRNAAGDLVNIGKAYTGLTDAEIATTTAHFQATTRERHGPVHVVEPTLVLEIAFDRIQESKRHKAGFALRFPRIVRIREDKDPSQVSTIDEVERIFRGQLRRESPAKGE